MPHLRVGIVGDVRPNTALLVGLIMSRQRMDDVFIITRSDAHIPLNKEILVLELVRADILVLEAHSHATQRAAALDISLEEVVASMKFAEECILPERDPLPRPPKSIRPKPGTHHHPVIRKRVPRSR